MSRWWLGKAEVVAKQRTQKQLDCDLAGACRHYANGYCSWGVKCRFRHERVLSVNTLATSETSQTSNPREVSPSAAWGIMPNVDLGGLAACEPTGTVAVACHHPTANYGDRR